VNYSENVSAGDISRLT